MSRVRHLPGPAGVPKSAATVVGDTIYVSGQVGQDPATGEIPTDFAEQVRLALANLQRVVEEAGGGLETIAKVQILLASRDDYAEMNEIYRARIDEPRPARSTIVTALADARLKFEIDAIAVVRDGA